jgi:hypothetical protein
VPWSAAAIAAVSLHGVVGSDLPRSTGTWPFNLAGVFALLLVFPDGPLSGRPWRALPWAFASTVIGLEVTLWGSRQVGGRVTGPEPAAWRLGVGYVSMVVLAATMILAITSLVVRYRRGTRRVRQQIRWLLFAGIAAVILLVGGREARGATLDVAYLPFVAAIVALVPASVASRSFATTCSMSTGCLAPRRLGFSRLRFLHGCSPSLCSS